MFCPNCGKDCADANFCSNCGTQLKQNSQEDVSKISKPNTETSAKANAEKGSTEIPTSMAYLGRRGAVLLYDSAVSISTGSGDFKKRTVIPFDQLTAVIYKRPSSNGWRDGVFLLRGSDNKDVPIPEERYLSIDDAAATIPLEKDMLFYHVFQLLKAVAPSSARFEMIIPEPKIKNLDKLAQGIDFDNLWNEFAPFRERAAKEIQEKHKIKREAARVLVDREFDARQKRRYDTDPLDAIRDLNGIVNILTKEQSNISRLKGELKEYQQQQEIKNALSLIALRQKLDSDN